ncbi:hypothetical protein O181_078020, partial [Austropuccinia psidii MF-1]|nr:hypothetical protein [Austropuccinia psidii MF-1]
MPSNLGVEQQSQIVGMSQAGLSIQKIAVRMGVPKSTVHDIIRRFREHGACADCPKPGRPPLLNEADRQNLENFITHNRRANLKEISHAIPNNVSHRTIRKAIHDLGKRSCIAPKKPYLCEVDFDQQLTFSQQFGHWNLQAWARIIWTDELAFELGKKADQKITHGMGGFHWQHQRPTCFLDGTQMAAMFIEQVYEPHLQPFYNHMVNAPYIRTRDCIAMMEDGTPIHTARISNEWRAANQIDKLPWPAHCADLNPIENVWKGLKTWVTKHHQPHTMDELCVAIQSAWDDLSPAFFEKLLI